MPHRSWRPACRVEVSRRALLPVVLAAVLSLPVSAKAETGHATIEVTPAVLSEGWQITGPEISRIESGAEVWELPGGAQLSRSFHPSELLQPIAVSLTLTPPFGPEPSAWPALELGEAVVFAADGGRIVFVAGEEEAQTLGPVGAADEPFEVWLGHHADGVYEARLAGQEQSLRSAGIFSPPMGIALSAGTASSLEVRLFQYEAHLLDQIAGEEDGSANDDAQPGSGAGTNASENGGGETILLFGGSTAQTGDPDSPGEATRTARSSLEVYTPPSIPRRARAPVQ